MFVDEYKDLVVALHDDDSRRFTVDLPNGAPTNLAELHAVAEGIADLIRASFL